MRSLTFAAALLLGSLPVSLATAAPATIRILNPTDVGRYALVLDDAPVGFLPAVQGGTVEAPVVVEPLGPGDQFQRKHIGGVKYEDFSVQCGFGLAPALYDWISATFDANPQRKDGAIIAADFKGRQQAVHTFDNALITEVTIPACDGTAKDPAYLTLKFRPETTHYRAGDGSPVVAPASARQKAWLCSNFRFELRDLPTTHVSKIDAFTIKQKVASLDVGGGISPGLEVRGLEFPNLSLTIASSDSKAWTDWFDSFVLGGKSTDVREGSLTLLALDGKAPLLRIDLHKVGIFGLKFFPDPDGANTVKRFTVELYCESMEFHAAGQGS